MRLEIPERDPADAEATAGRSPECSRGPACAGSMDDFGTGASSLRFLHRFPGDAVKIDRSFVLAMADDEGAFRIVKAILRLAHELGLAVGRGGRRDAGVGS